MDSITDVNQTENCIEARVPISAMGAYLIGETSQESLFEGRLYYPPVPDEDTLALLRASAEQLCELIMRKLLTPHIRWEVAP